jgi:hypothetical protein
MAHGHRHLRPRRGAVRAKANAEPLHALMESEWFISYP